MKNIIYNLRRQQPEVQHRGKGQQKFVTAADKRWPKWIQPKVS